MSQVLLDLSHHCSTCPIVTPASACRELGGIGLSIMKITFLSENKGIYKYEVFNSILSKMRSFVYNVDSRMWDWEIRLGVFAFAAAQSV